jgi:hypothetical protein
MGSGVDASNSFPKENAYPRIDSRTPFVFQLFRP